MNSRTLLCILLAAGLSAAATAQDDPADVAGETAASQADAGEEPAADPLNQLTEPGEHHDHLDRLAGDWDLTIRVWPTPEGEPIESAGTAEARWILDRRFLWTIYRAELFGQPFEAWSIEGYDNQAGEYVGTWRDTQGTYTLVYRGRCKLPPLAEGETREESSTDGTYREMTTKLTDPASGEKLDIRTELRLQQDGSAFVQESFLVLSPEESLKNLEMVGRRRGD
jgi:hypothetical protein